MYTTSEIAKKTRESVRKYSQLPQSTVEDKIVAAIISDIYDRSVIKREWENISDEVLSEILEVWREIIRQENIVAACPDTFKHN